MEENSVVYALWLMRVCDHRIGAAYRLLKIFGTPKGVYDAAESEKDFYKRLPKGTVLRLEKDSEGAKEQLALCKEKGIRVYCREDADYPKLLKEVYRPPIVLYAKGREMDLNRIFGVSVVGARRCTKDGIEAASRIGKTAGENGMVIVSGMALGIDGAAHRGALEAGASTIAVLAGGVDLVYPPEHHELYERISEYGMILSEQPPGTAGEAKMYQERNRIIVGLSHAVVITEGKKRSGTSITARLATECNRDVFAVPGNPVNPKSELPNELILDGATPLIHPFSLVKEYLIQNPEKLEYGLELRKEPVSAEPVEQVKNEPKRKKENSAGKQPTDEEQLSAWLEKINRDDKLSDTEKKILNYLGSNRETVGFDEICDDCGIPAATLGSTLIILQMRKLVEQSAGGRYRLRTDAISGALR